jgi:hypothetical protein
MQTEEKSVECVPLDDGNDWVAEPIKRFSPNFAAWARGSAEHMIDLPVMHATGIEEASKFSICMATLGDGVGAHQNIAVSKRLFIRFLEAKGIGFMGHFGSQDLKRHQIIP